VHAPGLQSDTTIEALERWVGPHARWELGRHALVTDEMVVWICAPPEVELIDAETIEWHAAPPIHGPLAWLRRVRSRPAA